jgi:hypothetical protein
MAEPEVPQAAVDAAWRADMLRHLDGRSRYRVVLESAAPHIAAAALRQAAEEHQPEGRVYGAPCVVCGVCGWPCLAGVRLRQIAGELVPGVEDTREGILAAGGLTEEDMAERRMVDWLATLPGPDAWPRKHAAPRPEETEPADPHSCRSVPVPTTDAETADPAEYLTGTGIPRVTLEQEEPDGQ